MKIINIWYSTREHEWLSNLCYRPFTLFEKRYASVEHAYQTWKSGEFDERTYKKSWRTGSKHVGRKGTRTEADWNIKLMKALILESFLDPMNASMCSEFKRLIKQGAVFTHNQDKGVWRRKFPQCLHEVGEYLLNAPEFTIPNHAEKQLYIAEYVRKREH